MNNETENAFKSRNGDTLADLEARKEAAQKRVAEARKALVEIMAKMRPIDEEVRNAEGEWLNIVTRLDIWKREFAQHCRTTLHEQRS